MRILLGLLLSARLIASDPVITPRQEGEHIVTTVIDDDSTVIEERTEKGTLFSRTWFSPTGEKVLEEQLLPVDTSGSATLLQRAKDRERKISWSYGPDNHISHIQGFDDSSITFSYNANGRCIEKKTGAGRVVWYIYDTKDRLEELCSSDGTVDYQFSYDPEGRICEITDLCTSHTVHRSFDTKGRLVQDGEDDRRVSIQYTKEATVKSVLLPDGSSLNYSDHSVTRNLGDHTWTHPLTNTKTNRTTTDEHQLHHTDPLGTWETIYSFDPMNQLQNENGEFNKSYEFDPFGLSASATNGTYDADGFLISNESFRYQYDALGRIISARSANGEERYRYDGFGRLQEITTPTGQHISLLWFDDLDMGSMINNTIVNLKIFSTEVACPIAVFVNGSLFSVSQDPRGSITALLDPETYKVYEVYRYSAFGHIHAYDGASGDLITTPLCPWLYSGKRWLENAGAYDFGVRRYFLNTLRWAERDPLGMVDTPDDRIFAHNNPIEYADPDGMFPKMIVWSTLSTSVIDAVKTASTNIYKSLSFAKDRIDWILEFRSTYEDLFFQLMGKTWLRLLGYNLDPSCEMTFGDFDPKNVRVTLINGILNGSTEIEEAAAMVSTTHGHVAVHTVYAATTGFSGDLLRGAFAKIGFASQQSKMLASLWKKLITEMGGPDKGGTILHYAHSLGATDTLNALRRMTPEERRCIRVATFGSPTLIDADACGQVDNYVSIKDGVPILDFTRYISSPHIHFIPSETLMPLADHLFTGKTYKTVVETLGQQFQEEFLRSQT